MRSPSIVALSTLVGCSGAAHSLEIADAVDVASPTLTIEADRRAIVIARASGEGAAAEPVFLHLRAAPVEELALSRDGSFAVALDEDGLISLIDLGTGELRAARRLFTDSGSNRKVLLDPTNTRVAVTSEVPESGLFNWDLVTNEWRSPTNRGPFGQYFAAFSPDGSHLAFLADLDRSDDTQIDFDIFVEDLDTGEVVAVAELDEAMPVALAWSASGNRISYAFAFGSQSSIAFDLLDTSSLEVISRILPDSGEMLLPPIFRPSGGSLLTATRNRFVTIRNPLDGRVISRIAIPSASDATIRSVFYSGDGSRFFTEMQDGELFAFDADSGVQVGTLPPNPDDERGRILDLIPSRDGSSIYMLHNDTLFRWEVGSTDIVAFPEARPATALLDLSGDGSTLAAANGLDIELYDAERLILLRVVEERSGTRGETGGIVGSTHESGVIGNLYRNAVGEHSTALGMWAPDSRTFASIGREGAAVWSSRYGIRFLPYERNDGLRFSPNGASYGRQDLATGRRFDTAGIVSYSKNNRYRAERNEGQVRVFDSERGQFIGRAVRLPNETDDCRGQYCISINDVGDRVAIAVGSEVQLFDVRTARHQLTISGTEPVIGVHLDRNAIEVVESDGRSLHSVRDGTVVFSIAERPRFPTFSPDGTRYAVALPDHVLMVDVSTGDVEATIPIGGRRLGLLMFTADSQSIITQEEHQVRIWHASDAVQLLEYETGKAIGVDPAGRFLATCSEQAELQLHDLGAGANTALGSCMFARELFPSPDGRFVAVGISAGIQIVRVADRARLELRAFRAHGNAVLMVRREDGRFWLSEVFDGMRLRRRGPLMTAPLDPIVEADLTPGLFEDFLAP